MDLVLVSSEHAKTVFKNSKYTKHNPQTGQQEKVETTVPIKILFEGCDLAVYKPIEWVD
jgi:hypothetical protein